MSGFSTTTNQHLIRSNLWTRELKEVLLDQLMGTKYVRLLTDFSDGDTLNIPSIGEMEAQDYAEGQAVKYTAMDTGNFTFTIDQYKSSATYIYEKFKQDSFYMSEVQSSFVPKQARALALAMEQKILSVGPDGQTATDSNTINGAKHRFVASGVNETITIEDFAKARYALQMANVPMQNLVAIVDPSVEYTLGTMTNLLNMSCNPNMQGIFETGLSNGMKFIRNIEGFDVYTSMQLKKLTGSEAIDGVTAGAGVANLFFSATSDVLPFVGAIRQPPKVDSEYNKDRQREEYVTTCRYGFKLFRPENLVVVLSDTDQVYAA